MKEILELFAGNLSALRYLAGFVVLPFLYLRECEDVHDDVTEALKADANKPWALDKEKLRSAAYLFALDWWLIAACGAFLAGVFALGDLGAAEKCCFLKTRVDPAELSAAKTFVEGALNTFGTLLALSALFLVFWSKVGVKRVIQEPLWK